MLRYIELKNWKSHGNTRIEFSKGVNVMIGIMGAGKSSVMDAISFGLFGTFPSLLHRRMKLADVITSRPEAAQSATVRLSMDVDGHTYTITRNITQKGADARLEIDGKYLQAQAERVNEEISSILKLDYQTFSRAVYSEQNNLEYFLDLGRSERKKQIDNMLGLDSFSAAEENTISSINTIRSLTKTAEEMLGKADLSGLRKRLDSTTLERDKYVKEQSELSEEVASLEKEEAAARKELELAKQESAKKSKLTNEVSASKSKISVLQGEIDKINSMGILQEEVIKLHSELSSRLSESKKKLEDARLEERKTVASFEKLKAEQSVAKRRLDEMKALELKLSSPEWKGLESKVQELDANISKARESAASAKARLQDAEKSLGELSSASGRCPVCDQELTEEHKREIVSSKTTEIAKLKETIKELSSSLASMQDESESLSKKYKEYEFAKKRILDYADSEKAAESTSSLLKSAEAKLKEASSASDSITKEISSISDELDAIKPKLDALKRLDGYTKQIASAKSELESKAKELAAIKSDEKTVYAIQEKFSAYSSELSGKRSKLSMNEKMISELSRSIKEASAQISELENMERKIESQRTASRELTIFKKVLELVSETLRDRIVTSINSIMQGMWPTLYPYGDYQSIRLEAQADDYSLQVKSSLGEGEWLGVDSVASGGEKSIACLAMRIALSMVIVPNLKWLILDEPTHNIDSSGISKFVDVLGDVLPSVVEQVFIITHDDSLKQIHDARIYLLDRDKALGEHTKASEIQ